MAWLKNIKTQTPIPATLLKWVEDESDTRSVADVINAITQATVDAFYPVGSIYMSTSTANPSTLFGGTWEKIEGRFILASGDGYTLGSTGGAAAHNHSGTGDSGTLRAAIGAVNSSDVQIGYYAGVARPDAQSPANATYAIQGSKVSSTNTFSHYTPVYGHTDNASSMPPYIVVNVWRRTA